VARTLLQGVTRMRESSTYQAILAEGRVEGRAEGETHGQILATQRAVIRFGSHKFGAPDEAIVRRLEGLDDLAVLESLEDRIFTTQSWQELLAALPDH
jgi:hypothetical protein